VQSLDLQVISQLCVWLQRGDSAWLCTVIETWGSSPRRPGSLMVCHGSGAIVGTLSGGCVEEDLIEQLQSGQLAAKAAHYKLYGETAAEIERFQLPCGGILGVLIEPIAPGQLAVFSDIERALTQRENIHREVSWDAQSAILTAQAASITRRSPAIELSRSEVHSPLTLSQVYGPQTHLFIIGITEISRALAQFALAAAYRVTVCDPRAELADSWDIEHCLLLTAMPDDALSGQGEGITVDADTAIVAVTHDPRIDDMGLLEAFNTSAFYIGAMGSRRSSVSRRQRLLDLDISEQQLLRLHAPIGLSIGSKTPVEIAIAIMAELISERARLRSEALATLEQQ
jgi:xanthine dehydrogenase accessory factor